MVHRIPPTSYDDTPIDATVTTRAFWQQAFERAFKTALQNAAVFFTGVPLLDIDWGQASIAVGVTVVLSLVMSMASSRLYVVESFTVDLAQRAARTFIATFIGALATLDQLNVNDWKQAAGLALSATVLSLITSGLSRNVGAPGTASLFPGADLVPVQPEVVVAAVNQAGQDIVRQGQVVFDQTRAAFEQEARTAMNSLNRPR